MNRKLLYLLLPAFCLFAGCSERENDQQEGLVPISLVAGGSGIAADTRATDTWGATLFASTVSGDYLALDGDNEWTQDVTVAADGKITLNTEVFYPSSGNWIYIVGVSPAVAAVNGKVTYTNAVGQTDLLYAQEVRGNQWKAEQFGANKKIDFGHLYTQLEFRAQAGVNRPLNGLTVSKIVVKGVNKQVEVSLNNGHANWSVPADRDLEITSATLTNTNPVSLKTVLMAPAASYELEVETNMGTYSGTLKPNTGSAFLAGYSHQVTLSFSDTGFKTVTVVVEKWKTENKDLNVN